MFDFILAVIILVAIGSCTIKDTCRVTQDGERYKWCSYVFDKEQVNRSIENGE